MTQEFLQTVRQKAAQKLLFLPHAMRQIGSRSSWWRYCSGEVLQMTSGKPGLPAQLFLGQTKGIYSVVSEFA